AGYKVLAKGPSDSAESKSFFSRLAAVFGRETITVPAGTKLRIRLEEPISTERNSPGDIFRASLDGPLAVKGKLLAPSRSAVTGQLTQVSGSSGRVAGGASLTLALRTLMVDGKE